MLCVGGMDTTTKQRKHFKDIMIVLYKKQKSRLEVNLQRHTQEAAGPPGLKS